MNRSRNTFNPSNSKKECVFPFTYDGRVYNGCFTPDYGGLKQPIFLCPIYKIQGGFPKSDIVSLEGRRCIVDPEETTLGELWRVPDGLGTGNFKYNCDLSQARIPIMTCKNNCPGGT